MSLPSKQPRPLGITVFAVLSIITTAIAITFVASVASFASLLLSAMGIPGVAAPIILYIPIVIEIIIIVALFIGKPLARTIVIVFAVIGLILELLTLNMLGVIINVIILWYMHRPNVKKYFGVEETH